MFKFSQRSLNNLAAVHPDLVKVAYATLEITPYDFGVIEGLRSGPRQHELFLAGKSKIDWPGPPGQLQGRHLTGKAIDYMVYVDGVATFTNLLAYAEVADAFKLSAVKLHVPIHWGGDNPHWKDNDHIELLRDAYPDSPLIS